MKKVFCLFAILMIGKSAFLQVVTDTIPLVKTDTIPLVKTDTTLRIINLNPFFTQHVDSPNVYQFRINRDPTNYYWYLKNEPVGLRISKDNGLVSFKAAKNYFLSGRLKYDYAYKVDIGVQSFSDPNDRVDTSFSILFFNTEIIPSKIKPTVSGTLYMDEGETVSFKVQCETGSFPFENILFSSTVPIKNYTLVKSCNDEFSWTPDFDFVKETDSARMKIVILSFTGSTRFKIKDYATVRIAVRDALNYPFAKEAYGQLYRNIEIYILQLKYAFLQLDKKLKNVKTVRTTFDLTAASTALTGTILNTSSDEQSQKVGKILPSIGLAMTPIKEATSPNKAVEQNQAALIRSSIKRLEYMLADNQLISERDDDIMRKTSKLRDELKQVQVQLIDVPVEITGDMSAEELDRYFNSAKVNKKYRVKRR